MRQLLQLMRPPFFSVIGLKIFILAVLMKVSFIYATDTGIKIVTSTAYAILIIFCTLWGFLGFYELLILNKAFAKLKLKYENKKIDKTIFQEEFRTMKLSYIINIFM